MTGQPLAHTNTNIAKKVKNAARVELRDRVEASTPTAAVSQDRTRQNGKRGNAARADETLPEAARRPESATSPMPIQRGSRSPPALSANDFHAASSSVVARLVHVSCSRSEVMLAAAAALIGSMTSTARIALEVRRAEFIS